MEKVSSQHSARRLLVAVRVNLLLPITLTESDDPEVSHHNKKTIASHNNIRQEREWWALDPLHARKNLKAYFEKVAVQCSITKNSIAELVPKPVLDIGLDAFCFEMDIFDLLLGRRDGLTPPCRMRVQVGPFVDARYYKASGEDFFRYFRDLCAVRQHENVLDVGCGCGQLAVPLTKYLDQNGKYEGFDIVKSMIEWCVDNISSKYPNFRLQLADIFNKQYNPRGKCNASEYKFPFENEFFDFVFVKSVFTHMLPRDMIDYLSEIVRVLKKTGRCLITYFLMNEESRKLIDTRLSSLEFKPFFKDYWTINKTTPEVAIAYDERYILRLLKELGLSVSNPVHYGSWCGRKNFLSYQDIVIAKKTAMPPF